MLCNTYMCISYTCRSSIDRSLTYIGAHCSGSGMPRKLTSCRLAGIGCEVGEGIGVKLGWGRDQLIYRELYIERSFRYPGPFQVLDTRPFPGPWPRSKNSYYYHYTMNICYICSRFGSRSEVSGVRGSHGGSESCSGSNRCVNSSKKTTATTQEASSSSFG